MKLIERSQYLEQLKSVQGTPDIKVITGVRRSGKSKLLESFIASVQEEDSNANVIHINFNLPEYEHLMTYRTLYDYVTEHYRPSVENYVVIDEVQMCEGFEKAVNGLHATEKYDIYITGSNAFLLSSDLATLFTGRTFRVEVYPFSFKEYCTYYEYSDTQDALDSYVLDGGMSGSYVYRNDADKITYLKDVYGTLILGDIVQKYNVRKRDVLERMSAFMMDNISNVTSARAITRAISQTDVPATNATVTSYMKYLCGAFAFYRVRKYDVKGKRYLASHEKYYLCDHAFRYAFLGTRNMDYGKAYENMVALELLRRGYEIYAGFLYGKEIDFVAMKQSEKLYIQVSDDISGEKTLARELRPLIAIKDAYPKMLIARTRHDTYDIEGIKVHDLATWLSQ